MVKTNSKQVILKFIKDQRDSDNNAIPLSSIINAAQLSLSNKQTLKALITLILTDKIEVVKRRRMKEELFFSLTSTVTEVRHQSKRNTIEHLTSTVELYSKLNNHKDFGSFHKLTNNRFKHLPIIDFLERCSADFGDLMILCRYLTAFFADEGPITVMDLGLSRRQIVDLLGNLHKGNLILLNQGLIEINKERGGIYLNGVLTPRLIDLLKGEQITVLPVVEKRGKGLYFEIKHEHIKPCNLYYNEQEIELFKIAKKLLSKDVKENNANLSFLLYGLPGTGKTEFAYQIAKNVQADIMQLNFSEIQSKWIGETEKNIRQVFEQYDKKRKASNNPIILLMNEADGLMNRRVSVNISNDAFHNHAQTQLLELLEDFQGIVIATTNLYQNLDEAFHRRFLFRSEIGMPNQTTREIILKNSIISEYLSKEIFQKIVEAEWSPAQIKNIEHKVKQLSTIQTVDERLIESLIMQDEMPQKRRRLGFIQKNNEIEFSQNETSSSYRN
jgi:DNA polymerase III delta prime subunit